MAHGKEPRADTDMAIRGRLDELPASEVVQFLTQTGRSGTLRFQDGRWQKFIAFENGRLIYAVSQHRLPPLGEILYQWGLRDSLADVTPQEPIREDLAKALEWRRTEAGIKPNTGLVGSRLGKILVLRGSLKQEALDEALEPESIPDSAIATSLVEAGVLSQSALDGLEVGDRSLREAVLAEKLATEEQVELAVEGMPERCLATLLVESGAVRANDAEFSLQQLDALQRERREVLRLGQYLIACGVVSSEQVEEALESQLTSPQLLGEILVAQGILSADQIDLATEKVDALRLAFAPLRGLRKVLERQHSFETQEFAAIRDEHRHSEELLASLLVETGRIAEADLRSRIEAVLADELSDLALWYQGTYEFFEGFSLADALGDAGLDRLHNFSFEASSLLLDAHYRIDELQRTGFRRFGPQTVLEAQTSLDQDCDISAEELRLMDRMNGRRSLGEVCAVLPGTRLKGRMLVTRLLDHGWVSPLPRQEACDAGHEAQAAGDAERAVVLFRHGLEATGEGPEDATIRLWIRAAEVADSGGLLARGRLGLRRVAHRLTQAPVAGRAAAMLRRQDFIVRPARAVSLVAKAGGARLRQGWRRVAMAGQDFLVQKGVARAWWNVRRRVTNPLALFAGSRGKLVGGLALAGIVAAALIPGVTNLEPQPDRPAVRRIAARKAATAVTPSVQIPLAAPVQEEPRVLDDGLLIVSRDGVLRRVGLDDAHSVVWELELGEYGDRLSSPTLHQDLAFVTNSRGAVYAVTLDGARKWSVDFSRVECLAPALALDSEQNLTGIVIAARESLLVLHPDDGRVLYRLQCGNIIESRPLVDGDRVWVGSKDNHVYCADWRRQLVLWDVEVGADVVSLTRVAERIVAQVRRGHLVALERGTGQLVWRFGDETRRARTMRGLAGGRVAVELTNGGAEIGDVGTGEFVECVRPLQPGANAHMYVTDARRFYYTDLGTLGEINLRGGNLWRCERKLSGITSLQCVDNRLVVTGAHGLWVFQLRDGGHNEGSSDE